MVRRILEGKGRTALRNTLMELMDIDKLLDEQSVTADMLSAVADYQGL